MIGLGRVGVASHDAGGAVVLAAYLYMHNIDFVACLSGASTEIFGRFFKQHENLLDISKLNFDTLITSTSGESEHELQFVKIAKLSGIRTISILDHWVNYPKRFLRNGDYILPDEIWVTDSEAYKIANSVFKDVKVKQIENPYKTFLQTRYLPLSKYSRSNILYCTEPIKNFDNHLQNVQIGDYDEFIALESILQKLMEIKYNLNVVIKLHPTEAECKYTYLLKKFDDLNILISTEQDLLSELVRASVVIGCNTMALVVANWLHIPVVNSIPNGCGESVLRINNMKYAHSINLQEFIHEVL
jgi:hypothetical protein